MCIYADVIYTVVKKPLPYQARIPDEIYADLYKLRESLVDPQYISDAPSIQDIVNVALKRLINDWQNPTERSLLIEELREQRKIARSRMGRKKGNTKS